MKFVRLLSLATVSSLFLAPAFGAALTRDELLAGAWVPERREFPVNPALNPCQDFYQYTCSKVLEGFELRPDRSRHAFAFSDASERLLTAKQNYLRHLAANEPVNARERLLKTHFAACLDATAGAREERALVAEELASVAAATDAPGFAQLVQSRIDQPNAALLDYSASSANQENPLSRDLALWANLMGLPEKSYYERPEILQDLRALYAGLFRAVNLPEPERRADAVVDLERRFAKVYPFPNELRDRASLDTYVPRERILADYPHLRLERFLGRIPPSTRVRVLVPEAFAFLEQAFQTENIDTLRDLLLARTLPDLMDDAYPEVFAQRFAFEAKHFGGPQTRVARPERCTREVMSSFGRELDAELLPVMFPNFPEARVHSLAERIRATLVESLRHNTWLSEGAKEAAIRKMSQATLLLFKPETDDEWNFTPPAEYAADRPYGNRRALAKAEIEKGLGELAIDRDRRRWGMSPLDVNAYYTASDNTFALPAGIMQYPFFDPTAADTINLAAFGAVVGHELGHGIDDKGSRYDEQGRLRAWMTPADLLEFARRGAQFIPYFERTGHDGRLTMGENIGDHVGLTTAFAAAFPTETALAQATREDKQAFFVQYGRVWCYAARPAFKERMLKTDSHALGEARVNEQVKHLPAFQEAFACKEGDAMYLPPESRIRVW